MATREASKLKSEKGPYVGTEKGVFVMQIAQALDVASVGANTTEEQTFTVPGLVVGDFVYVNKPSLSEGLNVANARVSAADTLALTFGNHTAAPIDPASETYQILVVRVNN